MDFTHIRTSDFNCFVSEMRISLYQGWKIISGPYRIGEDEIEVWLQRDSESDKKNETNKLMNTAEAIQALADGKKIQLEIHINSYLRLWNGELVDRFGAPANLEPGHRWRIYEDLK